MYVSWLSVAVLIVGMVNACAGEAVSVRETASAIVLDNGLVALTIDKRSGNVASLIYRPDGSGALELGDGSNQVVYFDANAIPDKAPPVRRKSLLKSGYFRPSQAIKSVSLATASAEMAEVVIDAGPSEWFSFQFQCHYVLRRGDSGFYVYEELIHGKGMPGATLNQTRCVIRAEKKGVLFTQEIIDEDRKGSPPTSTPVGTPQDATYRLADGTAYTKYDMSQFVNRFSAYGFAGHETGLWFTWPSTEFSNGGPDKQELTVQIENVVQAIFQGAHFGASPIHVVDDESWSKFFGPVFIYANHGGDSDALWGDARKQAERQKSQVPFEWLKNPEYPLERGSVAGRVVVKNVLGTHVGGAWVIVDSEEPGEEKLDYAMRCKGYNYWTRVGDDGRFEIPNLRPGRYTLFVSGADQFEAFQKTSIHVEANRTTDLGALEWNVVTHGKRLWQVGIADRSTAEFHDGAQSDYRNFDTFQKYLHYFPHDVTFTIGQSREAVDWEYAQWAWYNEKPYWTIRFGAEAGELPAKGVATLTIGIASAQPAGELLVNVNGKQVGKIDIPKTGGSGYRSGAQDNRYVVQYVPFDASLLHAGVNEVTLGQSRMKKFSPALITAESPRPKSDIMYDAIRLEVQSQ